jgi:hypothetical protein
MWNQDLVLRIAVIMESDVCQEKHSRVIHSKDNEIIGMVHPQQSLFLKQLLHCQATLNLDMTVESTVACELRSTACKMFGD